MRNRHKVYLAVILFVALIGLYILRRYQQVPWEEFQNAARDATSVKIVEQGMVAAMPHAPGGEVLYEENDSSDISEFVENIVVKLSSPGACECVGALKFEFYSGDQLILKMTLHHGKAFRWNKSRLRGDAQLSSGSKRFVAEWLAERDIVPSDL